MLIIPGPKNRVFCTRPQEWASTIATDYLARFGTGAAGATGDGLITNFGWTVTGAAAEAGSGADFNSSADVGTPPGYGIDATTDVVASPVMFGDYAHMAAVAEILGYHPSSIELNVYAAFSTASNDEVSTALGWAEDGTAINAASGAGQIAAISSNGTNFELGGNNTVIDVGPAITTGYHKWTIGINGSGIYWAQDDTLIDQALSIIAQDEFPMSFAAGVVGSGSNDIELVWVHVRIR